MKKLITMISLVALIFAGCSNPVENSTDPVTPAFSSMNKEMEIGSDNPVTLPSELYVEKQIDGGRGGSVELNGQFINAFYEVVTVSAKLSIPDHSFSGVKTISIRTDRYFPVLEFNPGGSFNKVLKLDMKLVGMYLQRYGLNNGKTDFFYIADNGTQELIKNDGLKIDLNERKAEVRGAYLKHFSRYGFIRKMTNQYSNCSE